MVVDSNVLRKKWSDLVGTKLFAAIKQAKKHFWWKRNFLDSFNLHVVVSTYTSGSVTKRIWNILMD